MQYNIISSFPRIKSTNGSEEKQDPKHVIHKLSFSFVKKKIDMSVLLQAGFSYSLSLE